MFKPSMIFLAYGHFGRRLVAGSNVTEAYLYTVYLTECVNNDNINNKVIPIIHCSLLYPASIEYSINMDYILQEEKCIYAWF